MQSDTKPRWERRKDARPQELLAAALDLFVDRGYAATRLEDVARRAGVSKGTLYLYFENKEELFKAVVRENIVEVIGKAENDMAAAAAGASCTELLRTMLHKWWSEVGSTRASGLAKLIMAEAGNFPEIAAFYNDEVIARGNGLIASIVRRGVDSGEFAPVDADVMTRVLTAPVLMLMLWSHSFFPCDTGGMDPDAYMAAFLGLVERGIRAPLPPVST